MKALVLAVLLTGCQNWHARDTLLEVATIAALTADAGQTHYAVHHNQEANEIIGSHGQRCPWFVWFPVVAIVHAGVAAKLPRDYRMAWQTFLLGAEMNQVYGNYEWNAKWW